MKFGTNLDLNKNELQNFKLQNLATPPANPGLGQPYFNTTDGIAYIWNSIEWKNIFSMTIEEIVALINKSTYKIDDDNLSSNANDAINKKHEHSNDAILNAITQALIDKWNVAEQNAKQYANRIKLTNTSELINDSNFETTKGAQDKATSALSEAKRYVDGIKPTKTSQLTNDSDFATNKSVDEKVNNYKIKPATKDILGGIKVGANLTVLEDGTLNANDNPASFIIKQESFTVQKNQTVFNLTKGKYKPNSIFWYMQGDKQSNESLEEKSETSFSIKGGLDEGTEIIVEYIEIINASPYPVHAKEHLTGGVDPIPGATNNSDGLMAKEDKSKIDGVATGATKTDNSAANGNIKINGTEQNVYSHPNDANSRHVSDTEKANWNAKETPQGAQDKANKALNDSKTYIDSKSNEALNSAKGYTDSKVNEAQAEINNIKKALDDDGDGQIIDTIANIKEQWSKADTDLKKLIDDKETLAGAQAKADKAESNAKSALNSHAGDTTKHITANERNNWNAKADKYATTIGNGTATEFTLTHNLNSLDTTVSIRETSTGEWVMTDVLTVDANNIKVLFAQAPSSNQFRVTIVG